jgi:putative tryptophan/tyrosine transport system substrate-binding protein
MLSLLRELVPHLREFGVLWGFAPPSYSAEQVAPATEALRRAANALHLNMRFWETGTERALVAALASAANLPLDALLVTSGVIHGQPDIARKIAEFAAQRRLPTVTDFAGRFFPVGGVLAYSASSRELAARTAHLVDRILKGAKPGELPIEQPTVYELSVNLKLAKALGLTIPPSLLARADQVIE